MKRYHYTEYEVISPKNDCGLMIHHADSFDSVVQDIDAAVNVAKEKGYHNDEKWLIVLVEGTLNKRDDGVFVCSSVTKKAVAMYDNGNVTMIEAEL